MYKLEYLPSALTDILEIESNLFELNPQAADKFTEQILKLTDTLTEYPLMYQVYEDDEYFRSMPLTYDYRLFYHVDEGTQIIKIHRVIHGMRDFFNKLESEKK